MRIILTILFLCWYAANATNYYVANAGSNSNNGTTTGTPFQTIAKAVSVIAKHDSVFLNDGDSWNEKFAIPVDSLYFGSYGSGNKPILTGFQPLSFTNVSGNIWKATESNPLPIWTTNAINTYSGQNTVLIGGSLRAKGRYPNAAYNTSAHYTTTYVVSDQHLTVNYSNGEIVFVTNNYVRDVLKINSQNGDTLFFTPAPTYSFSGRVSFYIQNLPCLLDVQNEWADSLNTIYVYSVGSPTAQSSTIDTIVDVNKKNNITFDGISFQGSNTIGISHDSANSLTVINCSFNNNGYNSIQGYPAHFTVIQNDSIQNSLNDGMRIFGDSVKIRNNYVYNIGVFEGMGGSGNGMYMGFFGGYPSRDSLSITGNTFRNIGYIPVYFQGTKSLIYRNIIDSFCKVKDDGGGVDCYDDNTSGSLIRGNIVSNGIGVNFLAPGIYLDYHTHNVTVDSNTISNTRLSGIHCTDNSIGANYFYDNTIIGIRVAAYGGIEFYAASSSTAKRNIVYSTDSTVSCLNMSLPCCSFDSNYYLRPLKENLKFHNDQTNTYYGLAAWKVASGLDAHSKETPIGITTDAGVLYTNPTLSDSTIILDRNKIDAKGTSHQHTITLHPFQSIILFNELGTGHTSIGGLKFN